MVWNSQNVLQDNYGFDILDQFTQCLGSKPRGERESRTLEILGDEWRN